MRWLLLSALLAQAAFANGWRGGGRGQLGPSWAGAQVGATWSGGLGPAWGPQPPSWVNTRSGPTPLVPITNHTGGFPQGGYPYGGWYPIYYVQPVVQQAPPQPPPQVIIEREVIVERAVPALAAEPAPPPQVIIVQQSAPPPPPVNPPPPPEPPKPLPPRTPGPDVYSWVDEDGVVNYSTRAPVGAKLKAKKLSTLAK